MKYALILAAGLTLSGCSWLCPKPDERVVVKYEYVMRIPPAESLTPPPQVPKIDATKPDLKQSDVADYMISLYDRNLEFERKLKAIAKFFTDEQKKLDDAAKEKEKK